MRQKGLVSICLPTFNRSNWLEDRLSDLLNQTYKNYEIIIVNDASKDDTDKVLYKFKNESKIKVINLLENTGCCSLPRNIAISHSIGEFISPCDDDTYDEKDKLEVLVDALQKNEKAVLAYGNRHDWIGGVDYSRIIENWNGKVPGIDNSQFIYRTNVYEKLGKFIYSYNADDFHLARAISSFGKFIHVDKFVSRYIWHNGNRSLRKPDEETIKSLHRVVEQRAKDFEIYFNKDFFQSFGSV